MGQWVSSREFATLHKFNIEGILKAAKRADSLSKKFCLYKGKFLPFSYGNGIGRGGKVLRIWSEPFATQAEAEAFMESCTQERVAYLSNTDSHKTQSRALTFVQSQHATTLEPISQTQVTTPTTLTTPHKIGTSSVLAQEQAKALSCPSHFIQSAQSKTMFDNKDDDGQLRALDAFSKASQKDKNLALEKKSIIKEWEAYKTKGVNAKDFIALLNAGGQYSIALSENKLYAWQRAYKRGGLELLLDERGKNRKEQSKIKELGLEELTNKLILASRGRVNISSLHRMLHIHLDSVGKADLADFLAKRSEVISYCVLERYVKAYLKAHPIEAKIIYRGEDAAVGNFLPALGQSNYAVDSINQIVEIDATSIDAIIDTSEIARALGLEVENIESWQKRFVLISLIDTYSGVCSFHISDTENALGVSRAIAKYITTYGKPKCIKSDNGSAFVSKYIKEVLMRLDIEHIKAKAYA
ncbi:transposase family protein, partial [Helicobacter typhlonius]